VPLLVDGAEGARDQGDEAADHTTHGQWRGRPDDPGPDNQRVTEAAREEGIAALTAAGISFDAPEVTDVQGRWERMGVQTDRRAGSSTWQSLARHAGEVETDYLNGEIALVGRLHGVARAALEGRLDVERLRALGPDAAAEALQEIPGIGPFYAGLVVVRATGFTDVLPPDQRRLAPLVARLYGLPEPASPEDVERIAEAWRPFRTWVSVLVRSTAARLLD